MGEKQHFSCTLVYFPSSPSYSSLSYRFIVSLGQRTERCVARCVMQTDNLPNW